MNINVKIQKTITLELSSEELESICSVLNHYVEGAQAIDNVTYGVYRELRDSLARG